MRNTPKTYTDKTYDYRLMEKFAKLLRNNKIQHRYYRKMKTIVIDDGFKTVYETQGDGVWRAWRLDLQVDLTRYRFVFHANSVQEVLLKSLRFKLIPYQKIKEIVIK